MFLSKLAVAFWCLAECWVLFWCFEGLEFALVRMGLDLITVRVNLRFLDITVSVVRVIVGAIRVVMGAMMTVRVVRCLDGGCEG